jgi:hypothetical protein
VGLTQYVHWVSKGFTIYDKATGKQIGVSLQGQSLWSRFGGDCATHDGLDQIVLYDKLANRWVFSQFVTANNGGHLSSSQCVAVSTTSDATGTYYLYAFGYSTNIDYPKMGAWPDAYYETLNIFDGDTFVGAQACAYDRTAMLNGQPATQICFQQGPRVLGLLPSDLDGTVPPPAGSPNYMLTFANPTFLGSGALSLFKFHVDFNTPSNSTFSGPTKIPVAPFFPLCFGTKVGDRAGVCVKQQGTPIQLDSIADRLMYRLAYRNFGDHESLVVNHSIAVGPSGGIRWYEIQNPNGPANVVQQGTFAPDSNFRWMGSIAMDKAGDIAVGYNESGSDMYPSIAYTGRTPSDPPNSLEDERIVIPGGQPQFGQQMGQTRWGDYSALQVDPVDDCTFWYTTEYMPSPPDRTPPSGQWGTHIANFQFPNCPDATPAPTPPPVLTGSPLTSFADGAGEHVLYLDANQHVKQLYWSHRWILQDLTTLSGDSSLVGSGSPLTSFADSMGEHVLYLDANQHVRQLYWSNKWTSGTWVKQDLTASSNSSSALTSSSSSLTSFADDMGEHVLYLDANQHVRQLYWSNKWTSGNWVNQDLTALSNSSSALAASSSSLTSFADNMGEHVLYLDTSQRVQQLYWSNKWTSGNWVNQDLTALTNSSSASPVSGSPLTSFANGAGEHVLYLDQNRQVRQLHWQNGSNWVNEDLTSLSH